MLHDQPVVIKNKKILGKGFFIQIESFKKENDAVH